MPVAAPSRSASITAGRHAPDAATRAKTAPATTATDSENARTGQSTAMFWKPWIHLDISGEMLSLSTATPQAATPTPTPPPARASSMDSTATSRPMRHRPAPRAARIVISRPREVMRPSCRFDTLAHAMSSTSAAASWPRTRNGPVTPRCWCRSSTTSTPRPVLVRGWTSARRAPRAAMRARACSRVTPGRSRPTVTTLWFRRSSRSSPVSTSGVHTSRPPGGNSNSGGRTPTTVRGRPSSAISRPTTSGSPPNRRVQRPWPSTATPSRPGWSS